MNTKIFYIAPALLAASSLMMLTGCSDDESTFADGDGSVSIRASLSSDVKVMSRSDADELRQTYGESLKLWLTKPGEGPVRRYEGIDNLPTDPINLPSGNYVAEAWAGDSVSASFDHKYFKAFEPFEVTKGGNTPVNVTLKIANSVVSVDVDDSVGDVLRDGYTLTAGHSRGTLTFEGRDERKGYFMMPSTDTDLTLSFEGTDLKGNPYKQEAVIEGVEPATEYVVHISRKVTEDAGIGGGYFTITVDASEIEVQDEITITMAPEIKGVGFNVANPVMIEEGNGKRTSLYVTAAGSLSSLLIESDDFASFLPSGRRGFDLVIASDPSYEQALNSAGIICQRFTDDEGNLTNVRINFETVYLDALAAGNHVVKVTAAEGDLKTLVDLTLDVTNAPVAVNPVAQTAISYTSVELTANLLNAVQAAPAARADETMGFRYRTKGVGAWEFVDGTVSGSIMKATVDNLKNGTEYEYTAVIGDYETASLTFTTLAYPQLPNAGFEDWDETSTAYLPCAVGGEQFWDSGNHGSTTLGAKWNITTKDSSVKHSGNYSIKLNSKKVVVKFAAGNVFTGKYLRTDGTDGVLGWGRPFDTPARPKALKGYVKYRPNKVTDASTNPGNMAKGDMDQGIVYVALFDDTVNADGWSVTIKTKTKELFDKDAANVVAYGETVFTEATPGEGMIEFTVPISEVHGNLNFKRILVVASASRYGDYFTGGDGTTMWLDDLELVY